MRVILNATSDDELPGLLAAAQRAMDYERKNRSSDGTDVLKNMGVRVDGKYYSVTFNKASVSVWATE